MSLGYKSNLRDLLPNFKHENYLSPKNKDLDRSVKGLTSYKSMTKIGLNHQEPKSSKRIELTKHNYEAIKSYKDLADKLKEYKFSKKEDKNTPIYPTDSNIYSTSSKTNLEEFSIKSPEKNKSSYHDW